MTKAWESPVHMNKPEWLDVPNMAALEEVAVAAERYTGVPIKMDQMDETQTTKCQIADTPYPIHE